MSKTNNDIDTYLFRSESVIETSKFINDYQTNYNWQSQNLIFILELESSLWLPIIKLEPQAVQKCVYIRPLVAAFASIRSWSIHPSPTHKTWRWMSLRTNKMCEDASYASHTMERTSFDYGLRKKKEKITCIQ